MARPGKGQILGRDLEFLNLSENSLLLGEGGTELKELVPGAEDTVLTVSGGQIVWAPTQPIPASTGGSVGTGAKVLKTVVDGHFTFRTLKEGSGIIITENANEISIEMDPVALLSALGAGALGDPTAGPGTYDDPISPGAKDPAILGWNANTLVADAVDQLNKTMGLLLPDKPPTLDTIILTMSGGADTRDGANILLASGVTDNSLGTYSAGTQIYRVDTASSETSVTAEFGSGTSGSLSAKVNNVVDGTLALDNTDNSGNDLSLTIVSDTDYPVETPGFWQSITAKVGATVVGGVNRYQLTHSEGAVSNSAYFLYDNIPSTPSVGATTASLDVGSPAATYSSGIPQLASGSQINVTTTVSNLSSKAYLSEGIIQIGSTNNMGNLVNVNPGSYGIDGILAQLAGPITVTDVPFIINNNEFSTGRIRVRGRNAETNSGWTEVATDFNVFDGNPSEVQELAIPVSVGSLPGGADADAKRIELPTGDTPDPSSVTGFTVTNWDSTASVQTFEAKVVGGEIKHDDTDYSIGYLPVGPNYSTHDATQYITFFFRRSAISQFDINVTGTYTSIQVTMADVDFGTAPNGWLDMGTLYTGAGIPGQNGSDGCAVGTAASGSSGIFTCTVGTESSSNATNNIILVRFKMTAGQSITALSFE